MTAERWLNVTAAALCAAPSTESPYVVAQAPQVDMMFRRVRA